MMRNFQKKGLGAKEQSLLVPLLLHDGKPVVTLSEVHVEIGNEIWSNVIILYVIRNTSSIGAIMRFITTEWNFVAKPKVYLHNNGFFIVKLNSSEDKNSILVSGPCMLNNRPIILKSWTADFDFNKEVLRTIPLWVQFPNLPLHYWGLATLSKMGNALGKPLYADEYTSGFGRISYARLLI
ncbi:hypothetical protein H5410_062006 [Solanum commersonii]|uniref:DUF4283 domain-containing protein n=1 Tax=Solanum commersonii TaxID=4109 RepID=A0A9J5WAY2_SOLCO|nr:hypothetical protein H5410_062006 [Solanum commersonii]